MIDSSLNTGRSSFTAAHFSDGETESETIDDYSQYSDKTNSKSNARLSLDSRSETPNSNNRSTTLNGIGSRTIERLTDDLSLTEEKDNSEDIMVEISKKTTIKKIISRTTSVNGVTQSSEMEEFIIKDSHKNENGWDGCSKLIKSPKSQHRFHNEEELLTDKKDMMSTQNQIPENDLEKTPNLIDEVDVEEHIELKKSDRNYSANPKVSPDGETDGNGVIDKRREILNKKNDNGKIWKLHDSMNSETRDMKSNSNTRRESWEQINVGDRSRNIQSTSGHGKPKQKTEHKKTSTHDQEKDVYKNEFRTFNKSDANGINRSLKESKSTMRSSGSKASHVGVKKLRWVDPFKCYHLKYDSKDDMRSMQNWIKQKRVALMKSNQNHRPKDTVDGKSNRQTTYHRNASPVRSHNYNDIKEYIIRGNIKENMFQSRHPFSLEFNSDNSRQNKHPERTHSNLYEKSQQKMANSLANVSGKQSLSALDKLDRRNNEISFQVSQILNKFDLIEQDMKFKYYSPSITRQYSSNSRLDSHLPGHFCTFHPHSCCHCHSSCTLITMADRFLSREFAANEHRLLPTSKKQQEYSPVKDNIEKDNSRTNTLTRFNSGRLCIGESKYSNRYTCESHISYLEEKLNALERKIHDIKLEKDISQFEYEMELQCQREDIERELNSLYKTI